MTDAQLMVYYLNILSKQLNYNDMNMTKSKSYSLMNNTNLQLQKVAYSPLKTSDSPYKTPYQLKYYPKAYKKIQSVDEINELSKRVQQIQKRSIREIQDKQNYYMKIEDIKRHNQELNSKNEQLYKKQQEIVKQEQQALQRVQSIQRKYRMEIDQLYSSIKMYESNSRQYVTNVRLQQIELELRDFKEHVNRRQSQLNEVFERLMINTVKSAQQNEWLSGQLGQQFQVQN